MQAYSAINCILLSQTCTYLQFQKVLKEYNITQETYLNLFLTTVVVEKSRHSDFAKFVHLLTNFREITGKKSADINYLGYKDRVSILMHACRRGTQQTIITLLSYPNIDLKATDPTGRNAAFYAIKNPQQDIGITILHLLFEHDPKLIESQANEGYSLLNEAIDSSKSSIVQFLLRKGANPNTRLKNTGNTISHELIKLFNNHKEQVNMFIILLLKNKANFEEVNSQGKSVFQALQEGGFDVEDEISFCGFLENSVSQIDEADIEFDKESLTTINQKTKIGDSTSQIFELQSNFCSLKVDFSEIDYQQEIEHESPHSELSSEELNLSQSESAFGLPQIQQDSNFSIEAFSSDIINLSQKYEKQHHKTFELMSPLFNAIDKIVQKYGLSFELVGSFATGLWTQYSDIDINLIPITSEFINFESTLQRISVKLRLKRAQLGIDEVFLNKNKISTIRLFSGPRYNNKRMDISIFHRNNLNRRYVTYINQSLLLRPQIRPLFFAYKKLLETFNLHDHLTGGIKTYTLFLMINSVVRSLPTNDVGTLFIHLALYYGFYFQYDFDIKQIKDQLNQKHDAKTGMFLNISELANYPHKKFNLMDPINPKNNMGGKNTKTQEMQKMFRAIYYMVSSTNRPSLDNLLQLHSIFD